MAKRLDGIVCLVSTKTFNHLMVHTMNIRGLDLKWPNDPDPRGGVWVPLSLLIERTIKIPHNLYWLRVERISQNPTRAPIWSRK